jgi:hypothetical protein
VEKLDLRKDLKYLYQPSAKAPTIVEVPALRFISIQGVGDIGPEGSDFQPALQAVFSLGYPVKFGAKQRLGIDYPVMPLEGLYWNAKTGGAFDWQQPGSVAWKLMMMVPEEVPLEFIESVRDEVSEKKDLPRLADVKVEVLHEGTSAQIMYVGPYDSETPTVDRLIAYAEGEGYEVVGPHHEIYIGDPNRAAPERLKTVLRYPVRPCGATESK